MPALPFRWDLVPRLSAGHVRALAALAAHLPPHQREALATRGLSSALGPDTRVSLGAPQAPLARPSETVLLQRPDGRHLFLAFDAPLAIALCARVLGDPDPELAAARLLTATERGILRYLVAAFLQASNASLEVGPITETPIPAAIAILAHLHSANITGTLQILIPESLLLAQPPRHPPDPSRLDAIPISFQTSAGGTRISRADLAALEPGDVLLLDPSLAHLRANTFRLAANANANANAIANDSPSRASLTITSLQESTMPTALLDSLPVEIHAELGRITLSARAVVDLAPGSVVALNRPLSGPVDLTANGRLIARGELVSIDDQLGVRIIELLP